MSINIGWCFPWFTLITTNRWHAHERVTHRERTQSFLHLKTYLPLGGSYFTRKFPFYTRLQYFSLTHHFFSILSTQSRLAAWMHNHTHTNTAEQQRLVTRCDVMWRYELVCVRVYRCGVSTDVSGSLFLHLERSSYWLRWRRDVTPPTANTHARTHMYIFIFFFTALFRRQFLNIFQLFQQIIPC